LTLTTLNVRGVGLRAAAALGIVSGFGFFLPHLHWTGVYVGTLPWIALVSLESLFFVLPALAGAWGWRHRAPALVAAVTGGWTLEETLRGRVPFGGLPWGKIAFSQADSPLLGWAWLGGTPLIAASVSVLASIAAWVIARPSPGERREPLPAASLRLRAVVATSALVVILGGGALAAYAASATSHDAGAIAVAAVQGDVPEPGLDFNAERRAVLDNHARGTLDLAARVRSGATPRPDVVLWPENSSDIDPLVNADAAEVITGAADAIGTPILVGAVLDGPGDYLSNAGIVWGPTASAHPGPGVRYVKRHPAPFAEYIPARSFFRKFSDKVDLVTRDFHPGDRVGALPVQTRRGVLRIGDVICFEVAYDSLVQDPVRDGARLLVVQTNNATFGFTDESVQQLAMSRVRAVETGRAVVHISTVGVSGLILPDGSTVTRSGLFEPAVLQATLPLRSGLTPAVRLGGWIEALLLAACAALARFGRRRTPVRGSQWTGRVLRPRGATRSDSLAAYSAGS
jgi:apolipoprotein N-acyltransferase